MFNDESYKVRKSNDLVRKATFDLSAREQKIILFIISKVDSKEENFSTDMVFSLKEFCEVCGLTVSGRTYDQLIQSLKKIISKPFVFNLNQNEQFVSAFINNATINNKEDVLKISIPEAFKPHLIELKKFFTLYEFQNVAMLTNKYSIRLYELLVSYSSLNQCEIDIDYLKHILMIDEDKYSIWQNFKNRVLEPALTEINELTDLNVTYQIERESRKAKYLHFTIFQTKGFIDNIEPLLKREDKKKNRKKNK